MTPIDQKNLIEDAKIIIKDENEERKKYNYHNHNINTIPKTVLIDRLGTGYSISLTNIRKWFITKEFTKTKFDKILAQDPSIIITHHPKTKQKGQKITYIINERQST